jgi:hypothetical protein
MTFITYVVLDELKPGKFSSPLCSFLFQPVYVGKGIPTRADHVNQVFRIDNAKPHSGKLFHSWIVGKKNKGFDSVPIITLEADDERHAFTQEELLTRHFGLKLEGGLLLNVRQGGNGGWTLSAKTKELIAKANRGANNPNWGVPWTEERRKKWHATWLSKDRSRPAETMQKTWAAVRRSYRITNNSQVFIVDDLTKFCADNKLPLSSFRKALKTKDGIVKSKKRKSLVEGWTIMYIT